MVTGQQNGIKYRVSVCYLGPACQTSGGRAGGKHTSYMSLVILGSWKCTLF